MPYQISINRPLLCCLVSVMAVGKQAVAANEPIDRQGGAASYQLNRWVIANGGQELATLPLASTRYRLVGTTGQILVGQSGSVALQNDYRLQSGFWKGNTDLIYYSEFE